MEEQGVLARYMNFPETEEIMLNVDCGYAKVEKKENFKQISHFKDFILGIFKP